MLEKPIGPLRVARAVGRGTRAALVATGHVVLFSAPAAVGALRTRLCARQSARQAVTIAGRCTVPVVLVSGSIGAMLALQSMTLMRTFGVERALAPLCVATIVRELAPGFAAVVVAMQGGAAIAAELGAMRGNAELDALEVMGVDARVHVAGPRIVGAALAAPIMNALAISAGVAGSFAMAVSLGIPARLFLETALLGIDAGDVAVSELKAVIFGGLLGAVCATAGFFAPPGPGGVGRAANLAVVASVVLILVGNYFINTALFGLRGAGVAL